MSFRDQIDFLRKQNKLVEVGKPISSRYEIAGFLKKIEPEPVLFKAVEGSEFRVAGNLYCSKAMIAASLGIAAVDVIPTILHAIQNPKPCQVVAKAPCQEVIVDDPDLDRLPILRHCEKDGGNYISSGVFVTRHPQYGQNLDFHRCMQISKTEMAVRIVKSRHFDAFLKDLGQVDVAICAGNAPNVSLAAATSVEIGVDELDIANALHPVDLVKAHSVDLYVPACSEFVIEGTVYRDKTHPEGPFVDLTETYDVIREEPVLVVKAITHRKDAIWQALLPGSLEHQLLMGMPREPTIFQKVSEKVKCLDVYIDPGGCSWLHAIVQIDKVNEDDGKVAIEAAFQGHRSCKHVFVVDKDIDIYDPAAVEWALATRFQGDRDLVVKDRERGSSLDPSAEPGSYQTTRVGFDLTKPLKTSGKNFEKAVYPNIDLDKFLP